MQPTHSLAGGPPQKASVADLRPPPLQRVATKANSRRWNEYIERYHYLGYKPLPGAQLRYFVHAQNHLIALLGFGATAWQTTPRDRYIGWDHGRRQCNLPLVVHNARFLILPCVQVAHLASMILGLAARALPRLWRQI